MVMPKWGGYIMKSIKDRWIDKIVSKVIKGKHKFPFHDYSHIDAKPKVLFKYDPKNDKRNVKLLRQYLDSFHKKYCKPDQVKKHNFLPFIKIYKPKFRYKKNKNGIKTLVKRVNGELKIREISYASHKDSLILSWYNFILSEMYEKLIETKELNQSVIAYRTILDSKGKGKATINHAKAIFKSIQIRLKQREEIAVITLDIEGFFDNIDHEILREKWLKIINQPTLPKDQNRIFKVITNFSFIDKKTLEKWLYKIRTNSIPLPKYLNKKKQFNTMPVNLKKSGRICTVGEFRKVKKINKEKIKSIHRNFNEIGKRDNLDYLENYKLVKKMRILLEYLKDLQ
jgi:uncharacterized protein YktA (UPF0223 family)